MHASFCRISLCLSLLTGCLSAQTNVLTQHNDIGRTGQNTTETILTQANVNTVSFGKLFNLPVDGNVYTQPLYMSNVTIGGAPHRVVFVATEHDSVYAFDASTGTQLWLATMLDVAHGAAPGAIPEPASDMGCYDISELGGTPEYGITGTGVIDAATGTLYVVSKTFEGSYPVQRLHALDVTSGAEKFGGPVVISATVAGTGVGSSNGQVAFDPRGENQRTGLLELNGNIYLGFGSHCDSSPWHGWLISYNATTLAQTTAFITTPNGSAAGIWLSGAGLAADVENGVSRIFPVTGNGTYDATTPYATNTMDYGDDILRMNVASSGALTVVDAFTPAQQAVYASGDTDVGSAGALVLPDQPGPYPHLLAQLGKSGMFYLLNRENLGGYNPAGDTVLQEFPTTGGLWGSIAYWNSNIFAWPANGSLGRYPLTNGTIPTKPTETAPQTQVVSPTINYDFGVTPSISANGNQAGTGIVWSIDFTPNPQILYAHNANNVSQMLWSSAQNAARDSFTGGVKFAVPTIADGNVFAASRNQLLIFGLLPPAQSINFGSIASQNVDTSLTLSASATSSLPVSFTSSTTNVCSVSGNIASFLAPGTCVITATQPGNSAFAPASPVTQTFTVTPNILALGQTQSLSITLAAPGGVTLGAPIVFTEGVPSSSLTNPDFTLGTSGTTCTGVATGVCTVSVQFSPQHPGLRRGAVKLFDSNNNLLATTYISGVGTNSQPAWTPGVAKTIYSQGIPRAVAVDGAGNIFLVDSAQNQLFKIAPGGAPTQVTLGTTLNAPRGLALDGAGNIYIADTGNDRILELPYGSATAAAIETVELNSPHSIAVDGAGNLFIANTNAVAATGYGNIIEIAAASGLQTTVVNNGLGFPDGVAVDGAGDLFIADWLNNRVLEVSVNGVQTSIGSNLAYASAVAVDAAGDVFISDQGHNQLVEVPGTASGPGTGTQITVASGLPTPYGGLALDGQGDVFVSNAGNSTAVASVIEIPNAGIVTAQAQSIVFNALPSQTVGSSLTLSATASSGLPVSFASSTPAVCAVSTGTASLIASGTCTITASQAGNSAYLAAPPVSQSFAVVGSGQTVTTFTVPSGVTLGAPMVFTEGVPSSSLASPDFTLVSTGTTCTAAATGTCSVAVQFTPQFAGLRRGAIKLVDSNNNLLSTSYISGIGASSLPAQPTAAAKKLYTKGAPRGIAVDGAGDVFFVDSSSLQVFEVAPGGTPVALSLGTTLNAPFGLALDGAGNLYLSDSGNNRVLKLPYGSNTASAVAAAGLVSPHAVAVDGAGNLFIANTHGAATSGAGNIVEITPSKTQTTVLASGLAYPSGIAVDGSGNVYIADWGNNRVVILSTSGAQTPVGSNISYASGVAVDAAGDVFIADQLHNQLVEVPGTVRGPGTGTQFTVATGLPGAYGLALDGQGDVFVASVGNSSSAGVVQEVPRAIGLTFTVPSGVTLGTPVVFTEGVPSSSLASPEFTLTTQNTCPGATNGTCTLAIQFTPQQAGLRRAAVKFVDSNNTLLATSFISGIGPNTLPAWSLAATKSVYAPTLGYPRGVTVDGAGNAFVLDSYSNQLLKITPAGAQTVVPLGTTLNSPFGLALDAAGDLYLADAGNNRVLELPYGSSSAVPLNLSGLNFPEGLAVDGAGNLFIANTRATAASGNGNILELVAATGVQTTLLNSGLSYPCGVALDAAGDVFIADWGNNRVLEIPVNGPQVSLGSGIANASAVAVDAAGDVFITDQHNNRLLEVPASASGPGTGTQITVTANLLRPYAIALDGQGNAFVASVGSGSTSGFVVELQRVGALAPQAQTISFPSLAAQSIGTSPSLTASASSGLPVAFTSSTPSVCTVSGSTATLLTTGICTVVASQAGSSAYLAATPVEQSFTVLGPGQTVSAGFTVPSGVTLGTPIVFTEGVPSSSLAAPDFKLSTSGGTTCSAGASGTCTVNVQFTPQFAGLRRGAVKLVDNNGNVLATSYIAGIGANSLPAWTAGNASAVFNTGYPRGIAVDGAGNIFVLDSGSSQIYKMAPGGAPTVLSLGTTLNSPFGLALDAAGNLYIADAGNNRIVELPYGSSSALVPAISGLTFPEAVAVDGAGNLFIANTRAAVSSGNGNVLKVAAGSNLTTTVAGSGLGFPSGLAVDAAGDVFIADKYNNRVLEVPLAGAPLAIGSGLNGASAVAVDAAGDVFIADQGNNRLVEIAGTASGPGTGAQTTIAGGLLNPYALALDGIGDVFIANVGAGATNGSILQVLRAGVVVAKAQTIAFNLIASQPAGSSLTLSATATSGLTVAFSSNTPGICTISGVTVSLLTSGTCTVVASQAGSSAYSPAPSVTQSFAVVGAGQATVTFTVPSGVTLGTPILFTEGVPSTSLAKPDFTLAATTCTGAVTGTCSVTVQVTPQFPGLRRGAVKLVDNNNNLLATSYVSGIGANSQTSWSPAAPSILYFHGAPRGVTLDGAGDVFFVDSSSNTVYEIAPGGSPVALTLGTTLNAPFGLALDGAGNLYIADSGNNRILELPYGGVTATAIAATGLVQPHAVAVDGAGNLFIANTHGVAVSGAGSIVELAASGTQTTVFSTGLAYPSGIAVDSSGNVFVADWGNNRVLEVSPNGAATAIGSSLSYASGVAVDAAGDVFIADQLNNRLVEVPGTANGPGTGTQVTATTGLPGPYGLALDGAGNVFVASVGNSSSAGNVVKIP